MKAETVPVVLAGYGHVGKAFAALVAEKTGAVLARYGLDLRLVAVLRRNGAVVDGGGLNGAVPAIGSAGWVEGLSVAEVLGRLERGVLADCTPSSIRTGEPGLGIIRSALAVGWHVATAGKGPLVLDYAALRDAARRAGVQIRCSAATAAALPTLDVGVLSLAGAEVLRVEGILNGTSNYVLTRMGEGLAFGDALGEARAKGIAEPDPSLDLGGWDTACKLVLIANAVLGTSFGLDEVVTEGIDAGWDLRVREAVAAGRAVKLLGRCSKREAGAGWTLRVAPADLGPDHPLFGVRGTSKGIVFETDTMGAVAVTGGQSDPRGAAAALLKDIINIYA